MQKHFMLFFAVIFLFVRISAFASPECPIISGTFPGANGTTVDNSATGWYLDASKVLSTGYFAVKSNRFTAEELGGEGVWYSKVFSTAGYTDWQAAVKVTAEGDMNSSEYVKIFYKIDGGSEVLLDQRTGNFGTLDFTSATLNGSSVQLVVRIYNYNNGGTQTSKYYIEQYRVFKEKGPCSVSGVTVTATAGNGGVLTCASPSLTLTATSSVSGSTYSWTGPSGFTSTTQNPTVSTAGSYTVTATSTSGTGTATVAVTENKVAPDLTATGGSLACAANVVLTAASAVANATYSWTGPSGFTSTTQNPTVSTAGSYTVTVKNPANGCTTSQTVTVTAGNAATTTWEENFTLTNGTTVDNGTTAWAVTAPSGSIFSVNNNEFRVSGIGTTGEGVWTSGSMAMTGKTSVTVSGAVRSSITGSAVMNDTGEYADYLRFYYKLNGGAEVLFYEKKSAINSHSTTNTTFSVSIPASSTLQIVVRARATGTDEFYYFDNVKITAVDPAVTLATAVSGPVTCTSNAQVTVTASGTVSSYAWTGPNGFTSTTQNPTVTAGGVYTVVATLPTGCTVSATATVTENKVIPDVDAAGAVLGCLTSVTLSANSTVANATYSWTGPSGFSSTLQNPVVSVAGTYTVTVKNPANGCTASKSVVVTSSSATATNFWLEDFTFANGTTSDNGSTPWTIVSAGTGTASVQSNEFKVSYTGAGETTWSSGVIDISGRSNVVIAADLRSETASTSDAFESDDYMRVSYKLNNGAEVLVYEDYAGIGSTTTGTSKVTISSAGLNGSSLQVIIRARNSDPTERYFFDNVSLTGVSYPTVVATVKDSLTCAVTSVTLSGSSSVSGVSYKWAGPGGFTSTVQNPVVTVPGDYILTVTNTATGCTGKDTVTVKQNITPPGAAAGVSGALSCGASTVTLSGSSSVSGVSYKWTGPSGFTSALQNPVVSVAGDYILTVTNPVTGCTGSDTVTVRQDVATTSTIWNEDFLLANGVAVDNGTTPWSVTAPAGSVFAVNNNEFRISGIGTTGEGVWTTGVIDISGKTNVSVGANVRSSVTGGAVMNDVGVYADYLRFYYKLNGGAEVLFAEKQSDINGHSTAYSFVSTSSLLTGSTLQLVIRARATGTDEFYYVDNVKVNAASGGSLAAVATVKDSLTCAVTSVTLSGSSTVAGVGFGWTGPGGFTSSVQNPVVAVPGDYILTVTNPATGCTGSDTVTVKQNITPPGAVAGVSGALSCGASTVTLSGSSSVSGVSYKWTGPSGFSSALQNPVVSVAGDYVLTVTNPVNGCTSSDTLTVRQDVATTSTIWNEDFLLANGVAVDNGTTPWSVTAPAGSVFAVNNNEFRISGIGTTGEGVWTTGVIDISGKTNVSVGANVRSSVTGGAVMNDVGVYADYLRFYYKLNGGAEVLFAEKQSDINGHSTTYSYVSTSSLLTGSTLQLVIRARATGTDEFYYVDNVKVNAASGGSLAAVATVKDSLTCAVTSVTLSGSSSVSGVSYKWTGPGGFTSSVQNPVVTVPGDYILTVTNPATGCTGSDTVTVRQDVSKPTLTVAVPGGLSCAVTSVNLTASSSGTVTWSGYSAGVNPISVTAGGKYYVTAKGANGCITTDSVTVAQDITKPTLTVAAPGGLSCAVTSVNLTASSNGTITWNGYNAGVNPISVTTAGKYYVTAKGANGCITTDSVMVAQDITKPTLTVAAPGGLSCAVTSVNLTASSNGTITWNGYNAGVNPITVTAAGKYYVTAKGVNGCIANDSVTVAQDIAKPTLSIATPATLTCATTSINLTATSNGTITWNGYNAGVNPISVTAAGKYYVTAKGTNGCITTDSVTVVQDITKPTLSIATPGTLTCATTSINLTATSNGTITWSGYNAGVNPITVTTTGKYYVTAKSAAGCTTTDSVTVVQDITKPTLSIATPATLTCATTSINLTATSNGTITWNGYNAGANPITVTAAGKYYVTAKSAAGCTTTDSATVVQDITKPTLSIATPGTLTCATTSINLTATSNGTITWNGYNAGVNPITVTTVGKYYVTAKGANGCTTADSMTVAQDIAKPTLSIATPATLTCATTSINLTATSNGTITWNGYNAGVNPITVTTAGKYYVTAKGTNGCTTADSVTVTQDITKPTLSIATPATLTCATTSINLTATSNSTITWNGYNAGVNPITVTTAGKYYVTAKATNGCTTADSVTVTQDITKPTLSIATPATLTCAITSINLTANSNGTITWNGYNSGVNPITITAAGKYYVTAKGTNGCITNDSVTVTQDITKPTLSIATPATLTCATTSINLTATSNGTITWSGYNAGVNPITVTAAGKYYVTAKGANGCTASDSVTVAQDIAKPTLSIATPSTLTCATTSINLTATSNGTITWNGYNAGVNPITVTAAGKYYVTAKGANGCITTDSVTVGQDITKPTLSIATPATLTCATTSINLTATSNGTITWNGFNAGINPISVTAAGKYYVTTKGTNGCITNDSVTVVQDITKPTLSIATPGTLTCATTSINLTATSNGTVTWNGYNAGVNPITVTTAGKYYVTAKGANGCTTADSVTVTQDITKPILSIATPATLTCATTSINLTATSNGTITWNGYNAGVNPITVTAAGKYYVTAKGANGCITTDSVTVTQDITKPTLSIAAPGTLTCATTSINLTATSNGTITWNGYNAGVNSITVTAAGKYYVTAKATNGCTTADSVTVTQDITKPTLSIATPATLTCAITSINLTANSNGTITWNGYNAGVNPITVTAAGKYYVTAKGANGCTASDSVTVAQDIAKPTLSIATPGTLTCATTSINLTATSNGTITWNGYNAGVNPITVTAAGKYYVTAKGTNGCITNDSVMVGQDITKPTLSIATPATLTCATTSINLTATSNGTITWNGYNAGVNPITVTAAGKYYVTAKATNGCITTDSVTVTQDITKPTLSTAAPGTLTCATTSINLTATSNGTITWNGYNAGANPITVTAAGKYYVTAKATNGCTTADSVTVTQDITKPTLSIATPATLTCAITSINLTANSNGTITWNGYNAGINPITVTAAGRYYVTAKGANGCTSSDSVTVTQDITKPTLAIATPGILTCTNTSINLTATSNGTITWSGNNAGVNPITVTTAGKYYVTAKGTNGCTTADSVTVTQDITKPTLAIATPGILTCATTSINLTATSNGTITWSGYNAGINPVAVNTAGKYFVTAKGANGCTITDSVIVTQDITKPTLSVTAPGTLTCTTTSINLTANSNGTITWSGYNAGINPVAVSTAGKYYVTAKGANGCTITDSVTVSQNITPAANVQAINNGPLTCTMTTVQITGSSTSADVTYKWSGPSNFTAATAVANVTTPGTYTLVVTNNQNGCTATTATPVAQNITPPANIQASNDGPLTCLKSDVIITGTSSTNGSTFKWTGPNNFAATTASAIVTAPGTYTLSVTNPNNGCVATTNTPVVQNTTLPVAVILPPANAPDPQSVDLLSAQSVTNANYQWTLTSADNSWSIIDGDKTATVLYQSGNSNISGLFTLLVTDKSNGCQNTATYTLNTASLSLQIASLEFNAYPNPFTDQLSVTFKSPINGTVSVEIYGNLLGNRESILFNENAKAGQTYKLVFRSASLPAGLHYCVIRTNGKVYTKKLILVR